VFVNHVIVAPLDVRLLELTALMTGSAGVAVVNVKSVLTAWFPDPSTETASKWYIVDALNPDSVAEWLVTRPEFNAVVCP
jgi:hypothetical protein